MNFIAIEPAPTLDDVWRLFRETDLQQKETARQLKEYAQEAEQRSKRS
ncbi:MAG: hypothetical protein R3E08_10615 [Thiotrichaceae bacterium]